MDGLETPYEVEGGIVFTDCAVCNKSIRGDTLYKIHLTTIGHIKKEDTLVARGEAFREHIVPDFKDIKEYLRYLKLDEPIIGLCYLDELDVSESVDPQPGPRYFCKLCDLEANLPNMANHIVGRRHRQKYLELKRKDLVTWDSNSLFNQFGKAIRAKAEVVERQEGQGSPKPLRMNRNIGKSNIRKVPQKHLNNQLNTGAPHGLVNQSFMSNQARPTDHHKEYNEEGDSYAQPYYEEDSYVEANTENQVCGSDYNPKYGFVGKQLRRVDYMDDKPRSREFTKRYLQRENQGDFTDDTCKREVIEESDAYRSGYPEEMPQQVYSEDVYPQDPTLHRRTYPENDPLKQFYSEEVQRRARSTHSGNNRAYDHHGPLYSEGPQMRHLSQKTAVEQGHVNNNFVSGSVEFDYDHGKGFGEELAQRRAVPNDRYSKTGSASYSEEDGRHRTRDSNFSGAHPYEPSYNSGVQESNIKMFSEPMGNDSAYDKDHLFELLKNIRQGGGGQRQQKVVPDRIRSSSTYAPEGARTMSNIPEPFKRFLEGATVPNTKRKRKSRFSDASQAEMDMLQEMYAPDQMDEYRPPRPEPYGNTQVQYPCESYQKDRSQSRTDQCSDSANVLDILNNIEIENLEEANFLKDKLLNLLNEFQAKKSATGQRSQESEVISKDYNHKSKESILESTQGRYKKDVREHSEGRHNEQLRQPQELHYPDRTQVSHREKKLEWDRPRAWEERKRLDKHSHTASQDGPRSSRFQYEEVFGQVDQYQQRQPKKAISFSEPSQGSRYNHDYSAGVKDRNPYSISQSEEYRMDTGHQHYSSLDKITSTLLELVARKS